MGKYVDVFKLKEVLDKEAMIETDNPQVKYYDRTIALHVMGLLATNKDLAEVVRCKDCKYKETWTVDENGIATCGVSGLFICEDLDFCSYTESKNE